MYPNKDMTSIVTSICNYFVTRYFSDVISVNVYRSYEYNHKQDVDTLS
jgi:hypothetical protein